MFARVADIGGRRDDDFRYDSATIPASVFRHVLGTDPRVSEYQVLQTARGADVLVVGDPDMDGLAAASAAALSPIRTGGRRDTVRAVERLQRHVSTGKLKRFVPLR